MEQSLCGICTAKGAVAIATAKKFEVPPTWQYRKLTEGLTNRQVLCVVGSGRVTAGAAAMQSNRHASIKCNLSSTVEVTAGKKLPGPFQRSRPQCLPQHRYLRSRVEMCPVYPSLGALPRGMKPAGRCKQCPVRCLQPSTGSSPDATKVLERGQEYEPDPSLHVHPCRQSLAQGLCSWGLPETHRQGLPTPAATNTSTCTTI